MRISRFVVLLLMCAAVLSAQAPPGGEKSVAGEWSAVHKWPFVAIHAALLPNGHIVGWARKDGVTEIETYTGDPKTGVFTKVLNPYVQVFCAGQTFLPDGTLLVAGGHDKFDGWGAIQTTLFDYRTNKWTKSANMNAGRWYPTTSPLSNGDVVVVSGLMPPHDRPEGSNGVNGLPQVWSKGTWRDLTGAYNPFIELYPWLLLAPDGTVFMAGPAPNSSSLNTAGQGAWTNGKTTKSGRVRDYGSAVMYEPGKVLIVGGSDPPLKSAETFDLNKSGAEWELTGSMTFARRQMNATILADGTVLATGGTSGRGFNNTNTPVHEAELWDPATGKWTTLAKAAVPRLYHSIALLLPDATVLNAGGGLPPWGVPPPGPNYEAGPFYADAQIFSPPYLFRGARPTITSAPASVKYGETFNIVTPDAANIAKVSFVRPGAVTHAFDESQRFIPVVPTVSDGKVTVTAPDRDTIAPPGPYMLFILSRAGVPSVAKFVTIGR
ncbi:MAG TPA: galactose oxidase-like domain-containing protein [Thermoanaerobaculia bacterium]|jgi:galactose oxidase|nr:galactose oxidase-like domain-containing protein [Thermoanaerobaculia bacterium]